MDPMGNCLTPKLMFGVGDLQHALQIQGFSIQACTGAPDMPLLPKQPTTKNRDQVWFGCSDLEEKSSRSGQLYVSCVNRNYIVSGAFTRIPAIRFLCLVGFGHV